MYRSSRLPVMDNVASNAITAENTVFVVLSFEGPDSYSLAGGLVARTTSNGW